MAGSSEAAVSSEARSICMSGPIFSRRAAARSNWASKAACEAEPGVGTSAGVPDEAPASRVLVSGCTAVSGTSAKGGCCVVVGGVQPPAWAGKVGSGAEGNASEEDEGAEDPFRPVRSDEARWGARAPFPFPISGVVTVGPGTVMLKVVFVMGRE